MPAESSHPMNLLIVQPSRKTIREFVASPAFGALNNVVGCAITPGEECVSLHPRMLFEVREGALFLSADLCTLAQIAADDSDEETRLPNTGWSCSQRAAWLTSLWWLGSACGLTDRLVGLVTEVFDQQLNRLHVMQTAFVGDEADDGR